MENEVETKYVCPVCNSNDLFVYEEIRLIKMGG